MMLGFYIGFLEITMVDIIDMLFVAILLYQVYKLIKGSVAIRIFVGFLFLYLIYQVVKAVNVELLSLILGEFMNVGVIAVIILFQQEIRKFLLLLGKTTSFEQGNFFTNMKHIWKEKFDVNHMNLNPIIDALKALSGSNTGALLVFSKDSELKFFANSGDRLDAIISKRLLLAIFNKLSPLHDGAAIINENRIIAARCILPVSENDEIPANFGLRHRAAIGMSENTDTLIIIVSEETGQLTAAKNGKYESNLSLQEVRKKINTYLQNSDLDVKESLMAKIESEVKLKAKSTKEVTKE